MIDFLPEIKYTAARQAKAFEKRDLSLVTHVIVHTTGPGPRRRAKDSETSADAAARVYATFTDAAPHFVIGVEQDATVQTMPLSAIASHTGANVRFMGRWRKSAVVYGPKALGQNCPKWWKDSMPTDPDLFACQQECLRTGSFNEVSIGIECVWPWLDDEGRLPSLQLINLEITVSALKPLLPNLKWLTHHAAMNPLSRTAKGVAYDLRETHSTQIFGNKHTRLLK